jgi:hypothetical protein
MANGEALGEFEQVVLLAILRLDDGAYGSPSAPKSRSARGGRAKRYYTVTRHGLAAVTEAQRSYQRLLKGLNLLGGANA